VAPLPAASTLFQLHFFFCSFSNQNEFSCLKVTSQVSTLYFFYSVMKDGVFNLVYFVIWCVCVRFLLFNLYRRAHLKKKTIKLQDPRSTNETCSLLGYYARLRGSSVPTFQDNLSVPFQGSWTS
jgi:hypothetical protein